MHSKNFFGSNNFTLHSSLSADCVWLFYSFRDSHFKLWINCWLISKMRSERPRSPLREKVPWWHYMVRVFNSLVLHLLDSALVLGHRSWKVKRCWARLGRRTGDGVLGFSLQGVKIALMRLYTFCTSCVIVNVVLFVCFALAPATILGYPTAFIDATSRKSPSTVRHSGIFSNPT